MSASGCFAVPRQRPARHAVIAIDETGRLRALLTSMKSAAPAEYLFAMKFVWRGRFAQAATKYGELAPTATTCCNACRSGVQTNLLTGALAGIAAAGAFIARRLTRSAAPTR